jgi:diadenosine tetraphosphate (Ap4A) HIT family hydrolase
VPSIFSQIIAGELPGRFVWKDDRAVAFTTIAPIQPGHTLVVPREEIDHWQAIDPDLMAHLVRVSQGVGRAIEKAFRPERVGMMIAGLEVPHLHIHVTPIWGMRDLDFAKADAKAKPADLDAAARDIRAALRALGYEEVSD